MIKTKTEQVIDAQNGFSSIVYLSITGVKKLYHNNTIEFTILTSVEAQDEEGKTGLVGIKENVALFKLETFNGMYGGLTLNEFESEKYKLLIDQIDYINKYTWTGEELTPKNRYWNLTKADLEIVT
jgi:CYTH domain-containing protein